MLAKANVDKHAIDAIAFTEGPPGGCFVSGLVSRLRFSFRLEKPVIGIHHLEGHLLSPLLASRPPEFPFVALLVSGGHTQLMRVDGVGRYELLGETWMMLLVKPSTNQPNS